MSSMYQLNKFHTTDLTLNVMAYCARMIGVDINDDDVANKLYWACCSLESFPEDEGFGSSDHYGYLRAAYRELGIVDPKAA